MNPYPIISDLFEALSAPARLQIVLAIGQGEACVCHLEAHLGLRQAYISQQLMVLREKNIITSRRDGKYIYYRLQDPQILDLIHQAAHLAGISQELPREELLAKCECPHCGPPLVKIEEIESR